MQVESGSSPAQAGAPGARGWPAADDLHRHQHGRRWQPQHAALAIEQAEDPCGGLNTIDFDLGTAAATIKLAGALALEDPTVLTIEGPGAGLLTIEASNSGRVFDFEDGTTLM
jgi:hypothetical protein